MTLCSMVLKDLKGLTALGVIDEIDWCARAAVGIQPAIVAALMDGARRSPFRTRMTRCRWRRGRPPDVPWPRSPARGHSNGRGSVPGKPVLRRPAARLSYPRCTMTGMTRSLPTLNRIDVRVRSQG